MRQKQYWTNNQKADFLIRVGKLLENGYTISATLELFLTYEKEKNKPKIKNILAKLHKGCLISEAIVELDLPNYIISFVFFAEHYGNVANGLIDSGHLLRKTEQMKEKIQKLIKYPLFLIWMLFIFMIIMQQFLFPQFKLLFSTVNMELPLVTKIFLIFLENLPLLFAFSFFVFSVLVLYYLIIFKKKNPLVKAFTYAKLPIIGPYFQMLVTYVFAINLSYLIKNGLSIYDSLSIFKNVKESDYQSLEAERLMQKLEKGETLQYVLTVDTIYLKELAYIVEHGQLNSRLDHDLAYYCHWLLGDFENKFKKFTMIVQPALFCLIGGLVLVMFLSIMVPIFSLINGI